MMPHGLRVRREWPEWPIRRGLIGFYRRTCSAGRSAKALVLYELLNVVLPMVLPSSYWAQSYWLGATGRGPGHEPSPRRPKHVLPGQTTERKHEERRLACRWVRAGRRSFIHSFNAARGVPRAYLCIHGHCTPTHPGALAAEARTHPPTILTPTAH